MDERERIEALAADGRITREEADRLLGVLDDIDQAEQQLDGVDAQVSEGTESPTPAGAGAGQEEIPSPRPAVRSPQAPQPVKGPGGAGEAGKVPEGLNWVEVSLLAGDLEIEVDENATSPSATSKGAGPIELEKTETGYRLGGFGQKEESILGRLMSGFTRGETRIKVPGGWGLRLSMKAGDVTIQGPLRFLAGHLLAGDLDADEIHGVNLNVSAGDIDLGLLLTEGKHRLHAVAGDINVRILSESDARVSGRVNIGDLSVPKEWAVRSRGIGSSFEHDIGQGRAELSLDLGTGDLDVSLAGRRERWAHD